MTDASGDLLKPRVGPKRLKARLDVHPGQRTFLFLEGALERLDGAIELADASVELRTPRVRHRRAAAALIQGSAVETRQPFRAIRALDLLQRLAGNTDDAHRVAIGGERRLRLA